MRESDSGGFTSGLSGSAAVVAGDPPTLIIYNQGRTSRYVGDTYERHDLLEALNGSQAGPSAPERS